MQGHQNERSGTSSRGNPHDVYTSEEAVELYAQQARTMGFFPQERKAVERYFSKSDASILDVGCGGGRVARLLHESGFDVTGIDISEPLIEKAREQFPEIDFYVADISDPGLPTSAFDYVVFSYFGLDYVLPKERRRAALREQYRLLKPGGLVVFSSHNSWNHLPALLLGEWAHLKELYLTRKNLDRLFTRNKTQTIKEGEIDIYVSNPLHQMAQLQKCGFTLLDVLGRHDGIFRFFESHPHYVAKK